ncbi:hypothetical protein T10_9616 [Trichinella papuae]|uniref:Secreted protein n=1 Tax=Trichinella papuae TaxID=268474 RepID=A0A0V1M520_9BILA|nr:hypothetical protein T10_9616 [Trichinella papuae]
MYFYGRKKYSMVLICLFPWLIFSRKSCQICPTNVYDQIIQYSFQSQSEYMSKAFVSNAHSLDILILNR